MRLDFVSRLGYQSVNYICRKEGTEEDGRRGLSRGFGGGACDGGQDGREGGGEAGGSGKVGRSEEGRGGGKGSREGCHEVVTQEVLVDREVFVDRPVPSKPIKIVRHVRQTVKETVIEALLCAMATTNPPLTSSLPSEPAREAETSPKPITATKTVRGRQLKAPTMRLLDIVVCERLADEWGLVLPSASVVHCSMKDCAIRLGDVFACEALAQIASPAGIIDAYVSSTSACLLHNSFEASFIGTTLSRSPDGSETTPEPASRIASPVEEDITPAILTPEEKNGKSGFDVGSIGGCHVVGLAEILEQPAGRADSPPDFHPRSNVSNTDSVVACFEPLANDQVPAETIPGITFTTTILPRSRDAPPRVERQRRRRKSKREQRGGVKSR